MAKPDELLELADRCEREGPSFDLDCKIERLCEPHRAKQICNARPYTTSLDAALTLVPDDWTAWELRSSAAKTRFHADLSRLTECDSGEDWAQGRGQTPALALCAAALRARASLTEKE